VDLFQVVTWLWGHVLVTPMTNFMVLVARLSFGNFGIAVIVFTLLMRGATWPLTRKQLHATRAMQSLQPRIQAIQKQHKDPKRRSEETMKLYREAGVSPLGCVWPMLIQFPIWIALYQSIRFTLGATPESLLDLSQRLYPWGFLRTAVPLEKHFLWLDLGKPDGTLIMAVLVGATTWIQQRMTTPPTANADPQQQSVNQTMMFMMPLMFAFFTLQFPSGLALYWLSTNVVSITLQYFYMGREFNWRQLFSTSNAPAPAVRGPAKQAETEDEADEDTVEAAPAGTHRRRRRRRRGRRRR
jgi:YidC/Oxa1 family membrane protein insertase